MFNFDWAKRTHKGLRRWVLFLLRDTPKTGAEIMDAMEGMSQGWWRPSPGSIYPLLDGMVGEGALEQLEDKRYRLTEKGREEIESPFSLFGRAPISPRSVEEVLTEISSYIKYLEDLKVGQKQKLQANGAQIQELAQRLTNLEIKQA